MTNRTNADFLQVLLREVRKDPLGTEAGGKSPSAGDYGQSRERSARSSGNS